MDTVKSTSLEREKMIAFLDSLKEKHRDQPEVLKAIAEIEKELRKK